MCVFVCVGEDRCEAHVSMYVCMVCMGMSACMYVLMHVRVCDIHTYVYT